jgi:IgA Peptidase M64
MKKLAIIKIKLLFLLHFVLTYSAMAGPDDGSFISISALLESGEPRGKFNIVIMGDGFTTNEQDIYNSKVDILAQHLFETHPFNALKCALNVYRMNIASVESGIDKPETCNGASTGNVNHMRRTPLDATYCSDGSTQRCVFGNEEMVRTYLNNNTNLALYANNVMVYVLVNDTEHGGCAHIGLGFGSIGNNFEYTFVHELGHAVSLLADEYDYAKVGRYDGGEPSRVDATISSIRDGLKWNDLVLPNTALPTKNCNTGDNNPVAQDIVGLFEGAIYYKCGVFRPQYNCKMRESTSPFCSVCRRKVIRDLTQYLCTPLSYHFTELLIREDNDPWPRGKGEVYFHYNISGGGTSLNGRWPGSSGEWDFDDDETRGLDRFFAGNLPSTGTAQLKIQMREYDWPDGDDNISRDEDRTINTPGGFEINSADWRLRGETVSSNYQVLFDNIFIKDDMDDLSQGDVYIEYTISNGVTTFNGRWPSGGSTGISTNESKPVGIFAGATTVPVANTGQITIRVKVMDEDSFFLGADDLIGEDTFTFSANENYGTTKNTHIFDKGNYRLILSVLRTSNQ